MDYCKFQIGQCRLHINIKRTKEFYALQPKITENCICGDCKYYAENVISKPNKLFSLLVNMGVDLSRQPNINPDGVIPYNLEDKYLFEGYYFVYGTFGKTSKKTKIINEDNVISEVAFNNKEFGKEIQLVVKQIEHEKLSFEFLLTVKSGD